MQSEKSQDAERKSQDLQCEIEKLVAQIQATASIEDIAVTGSSAKTKVGELVVASNAVSSAIADISDSLSLREAQAEIINKWWK